MKLGIVAGEASGDILGAGLIKSLRELSPELHVTGIGGPLMINQHCDSLFEMEKLSVMGLIEPLFHLPELFKIRSGLFNYFTQHRPDVFIGIDSPDFNLGLELKLRQQGIPIVHYVSPSVWAWRKNRIHKIKKAVDLMLTLFPFEADFYRQHNVPVCFVGHPLADLIPLHPDKLAARKSLQLDSDVNYIAILPGSRRNEIKYLSETFIHAAYLCWKKNPKIKFITSAINDVRNQEFQQQVKRLAPDLPIEFFVGRSHDVMAAADCVLVTSGTATLETMLFKRPMVVAYKMSAFTFQLARYLVKLKFISLPNLLADEMLVPEFIQQTAEPETLSAALLDYINHPEKIKKLEEKFLEIHIKLRQNANQTAAKAVLELIKNKE
jgi:lipid-A-disaccharide synthase